MAEMVQSIMDGMVPALRELMDDGIFSEDEIRSIVSRRRESEYLLRRRVARKADFLRYAEAEMNLERLRQLRAKQIKRRQQHAQQDGTASPRKEKERKSQGDGSVIRNIHFIFTRATRKWRNDVSLFLLHAEYAKKTKSFRMLGRIYAEALQVHPKNAALWIEAASHEFFGHLDADADNTYGGSIENARVLMQRGIRVNPTSQQLYLQYFSLEWHYAQKLRGRREIQQLTKNDDESDHNDIKDERSNDPNSALYNGAVPLVIYKMAIQKIPNDVAFRLKFLSLCNLFPQTTDVKRQIMQSIEADFSHLPGAWIARATHVIDHPKDYHLTVQTDTSALGFFDNSSSDHNLVVDDDLDQTSAVLSILDQAVQKVPTSEMYQKSIDFIQNRADMMENDICIQFLKKLFAKAKTDKIVTPELKSKWASYLINTRDIIEAEKILRHATIANKNCPYAPLWLQYADLIHKMDILGLLPQLKKEYENEPKSSRPPMHALDVLRLASNKIPIYDPSHMTILIALFKHMIIQNDSKKKLEKEIESLFARILLVAHDGSSSQAENNLTHESIPELCLSYLQYASTTGGLVAARKVYENVLFHSTYVSRANPRVIGNIGNDMRLFFDACINLEKSSSSHFQQNGSKTNKRLKLESGKAQYVGKHQLKRIYSSAIQFYNNGGDLPTADFFLQEKFEDIGSD